MSTDDILAANDVTSPTLPSIVSDSALSRTQRSSRASSTNLSDSSTTLVSNYTVRPIGVAEPQRRASATIIIRSIKSPVEGDLGNHKSVQVNTIIRSCGRCAGSSPSPGSSLLSLRKHHAISSSPSPGDLSSGCEDEDTSPTLAPPNLDRLRQRRATLVAKAIIHQMATQPSMSAADEAMPSSLVHLATQRARSSETSSVSLKHATRPTSSASPESPKKRHNQEEFLEISKQISSLLTPSDDEN